MLRTLRDTLDGLGLVEVETPVRIPAPAMERHIDALPSGDAWLRTSPELHMKRLLAAGMDGIYQIGPCFRSGESGPRHNPEFTMLEWYRTRADYRSILEDCRLLLHPLFRAARANGGRTRGDPWADSVLDWEIISVRTAYLRWAGWDPLEQWDEDRFNQDMAFRIEPALPADRPVVLIDYPAPAAALARLSAQDSRLAERWELYFGGFELCNAFSELTDAAEQRRRFEVCRAERERAGAHPYPIDIPFLEALERGLPPCGGAALGVDRLAMLLLDADDIRTVRCFCNP